MIRFSVILSLFPLLGVAERDNGNPFNQILPDCRDGYQEIKKISPIKAILCPMIKDEEGFLSEFVAYHQMHGFDHIMFFDHQSRDHGIVELEPWIKTGFVSFLSNWTVEDVNLGTPFKLKTQFEVIMNAKNLLESSCKAKAMEWGYDLFVSLDLDEYLVPIKPGITAVDALVEFTHKTHRRIDKLSKLNFQSSPHILEPVNLLTIEAYQTRMEIPSRMTYFKNVQNKVMLWLKGPAYTDIARTYVIHCCNFHGCDGTPSNKSMFHWCRENSLAALKEFHGGKKVGWIRTVFINHYGRSLEKFGLKTQTWKTSDGEDKGYDLNHFLDRNVGWTLDTTALRYNCQLRAHLANVTGSPVYFRPGDMWYRNTEFGRLMTDGAKGRRGGVPIDPDFKVKPQNPYHYHGHFIGKSGDLL